MKSTSVSKKQTIDFTEGKPASLILQFFWPLLMTSMCQQLYNFVDSVIVGRGISDNALAAVGNMGSLFFLIVGFSFGLANGFGILIAQSFGAKDFDELHHRLAGTIQLGAILAVVLTIFSVLFLPNALTYLRTDPIIFQDSLKYGYILFGGLFVGITYNISAAILRSLGDSQTPLVSIIVSSVTNLCLDSLFIFVFKMGVEGAAIATIIAQVVSVGICLKKLFSLEMIRLSKADFANNQRVWLLLISNGLPMALMNSITAIGCMVVQYFVNGYGVVYTAAYAACGKYLNLFMNPAATMANAISAYTSQNYGAKKFERITDGIRFGLKMVTGFYVVLGGVMILFPANLARVLLSGKDQIELVCIFLPACGIMLIFLNILFIVRAVVQGMGKPMLPMVSGIMEMILRTAVISILMSRIGFRATAFAEISAWIGALVINAYAMFKYLLPEVKIRRVLEVE
ncbi:MATE family efflux transporter [Pseudobutyrivibrio xylanivorans]|uniref:Putative efflux protein, MATE family n=1 Tax=Pseudobutyrivibrio xylanivorans DSM 14809 TaxID=1123012 RepID=A0A1M6ABY1_PSEXY|nr:MATE family efflux transporter [Pseudobutyrivibrio xylanivorans]SHI33937.1 putative efflux protein, MATE family [Pseudobutyrivibrio xylanivorans DSM 14809]